MIDVFNEKGVGDAYIWRLESLWTTLEVQLMGLSGKFKMFCTKDCSNWRGEILGIGEKLSCLRKNFVGSLELGSDGGDLIVEGIKLSSGGSFQRHSPFFP